MTKEERIQELREKIAKQCYLTLYPDSAYYWDWLSIHQDAKTAEQFYTLADQILTLIKSACYLKAERELPFISLKEAEEFDKKWSNSNFTDSLQEFGKKAQLDLTTPGSEGRVWASVYQW